MACCSGCASGTGCAGSTMTQESKVLVAIVAGFLVLLFIAFR